MPTDSKAMHTRVNPKDIQLTGMKHAKAAIADLLDEQSQMAIESNRLKAQNADLLAALEWIAAGSINPYEEPLTLAQTKQLARAAIARAKEGK